MNEINVIEKQVSEATEKARALTVTNLAEYESAIALSLRFKALEKSIKETFDPIVSKALETHREAVAQRKKHLEPVQEVQRIVDTKALNWRSVEIERQNEERRRKEEEAKRNEENLRLAEAEHLEKQGKREAAQAVLDAPIVASSVAVAEAPKMAGFSVVTSWDFRIVSPDLLPREFLVPDESKIRGVVRAMKAATKIPGVDVFSVESARKSVR